MTDQPGGDGGIHQQALSTFSQEVLLSQAPPTLLHAIRVPAHLELESGRDPSFPSSLTLRPMAADKRLLVGWARRQAILCDRIQSSREQHCSPHHRSVHLPRWMMHAGLYYVAGVLAVVVSSVLAQAAYGFPAV